MFREHLRSRNLCAAVAAAVLLAVGPSLAQAVTISWSTVGDPGNSPDSTGYGAVNYVYNIGTYDVTIGQYTAFLNAVATSDPYFLYVTNMPNQFPTCGITRSGNSGAYTYAVVGNPNMPVFDVTWGSAARFANWMQNGEPTGLGEVAGSTETGAYTLNGATSDTALMAVTRNANATIFLPSENEWYKAAYYNPADATYWAYPTQSNSLPSNALSATGTNNANFNTGPDNGITSGYTDPVNILTPVGYFAGSPGPYGTYDMGGDVWQWNEGDVGVAYRDVRGGAWIAVSTFLDSSTNLFQYMPNDAVNSVGFRLASLPTPEPATWLLATLGAGGLWFARRRRTSAFANR